MKRLLLLVVSAAILPLFAEAEAPQGDAAAESKAKAKAEAESKAKAKNAKKAKPAKGSRVAPKKAGFQAYEAGPWKKLDNRKGLLRGMRLSESDLVHQPVLVTVFDPGMDASADDAEKNPGRFVKMPFNPDAEALPLRFLAVNAPTRALTDDEEAKGKKLKTYANPGAPWYLDFGLEKEPANPGKKYPFFYVVSTGGKVVYAGENSASAVSAVQRDIAAQGGCDALFGYVKASQHAEIVAKLKLGDSSLPTVKSLTKFASAKADSEAKAEAQALLDALEQSKGYWETALSRMVRSNPPRAMILAQALMKTFPRDKSRYQPSVDLLKANPVVGKIVKTYERLLALKEKVPEKKSDLAKAYVLACNAEKMCVKGRKEFGERLPSAYMRLEELVMTVKANLEAAGCGPKN